MSADPPAEVKVCKQVTVRVEHDRRGRWAVAVPDQPNPVSCETFDDARRIAYLCAAHARPCELIVYDAYHRVVRRELINGHEEPRSDPHLAAARGRPAS